jgi:hypothetical protein
MLHVHTITGRQFGALFSDPVFDFQALPSILRVSSQQHGDDQFRLKSGVPQIPDGNVLMIGTGLGPWQSRFMLNLHVGRRIAKYSNHAESTPQKTGQKRQGPNTQSSYPILPA